MNQLRLIAPFGPSTGYAKMARAVLRSLLLTGYEVQAIESDVRENTRGYIDGSFKREFAERDYADCMIPDIQRAEMDAAFVTTVSPDAPTLMIQLPHNFTDYRWKEYAKGPMIGWTMTESDDMCPLWRHGLRHTDLTLAPSRYVHETFKRVVPDVATRLVPIPVDDRLWSPDEYVEDPGRNRPPFLFLSIFTTSERKQWRVLMQAFAEEFSKESDKVGLIVKPARTENVDELAGWCREMGAWVHVDREKRNDWTLGALYRVCNVYLQPSSEGQGLTYIEAGMCGRPSIALNKSGSIDVVNEQNGYLVPSEMQPLIGHMPMWYPRSHKFAQCEIDTLRLALRQAYENEVSGAGKGQQALESTKAFTCAALAPKIRAAIEEGVDVAKRNHSFVIPPLIPKWGFVSGAWGDVFCACGKVVALLKKKGMEQIGVIYYGRDPKIAAWLQQQTWCREVIPLIETDVDEMTKEFGIACQVRGHHSIPWLSRILDKFGYHAIDTDEVAFTQLRLNEAETPQYWSGPRLSPDSRLWAQETAEDIGRPFYVLNPISIASNKMRDHWRFLNDALVWLLEEAERNDTTFALVCEQVIDWPAHPRLVNLSGQSKTMQDVLALAELSQGVITTSNNLGIYTPLAKIPAVVMCARTCGNETFYYRWYSNEYTRVVDYGDAMPRFMDACEGLFAERGTVAVLPPWAERVAAEIASVNAAV